MTENPYLQDWLDMWVKTTDDDKPPKRQVKKQPQAMPSNVIPFPRKAQP
jgi:hypothetical protein